MADQILLQLVLFALASSNSKELDKAELAASIKNGDRQAFRTFYENHHEQLFRFLLSKNIAAEPAEDLIQQAFIYIWEHRSSIDPSKSLRAYLFKIAYTRMLNYFRNNKKFDESEAIPEQQTDHTPEDVVRSNELQETIKKAIRDMPEKRSQVFELCFMEQFTYREVAQAMDISVKTVENHMGLAFKDMRKALKNFL